MSFGEAPKFAWLLCFKLLFAKIMPNCPLLVLKGIYHYWICVISSRGLKQMEVKRLQKRYLDNSSNGCFPRVCWVVQNQFILMLDGGGVPCVVPYGRNGLPPPVLNSCCFGLLLYFCC